MSQGKSHRATTAGLLLACLAAAPAWAADKEFSLGLQGHERTTLADVGLPAYPGAKPYSETSGDKPAVSIGAWAGAFGLRVNAMKFQVADAPARVAAFYGKALARHGDVLDCREPAARSKPPKNSGRISCDGGAPAAGEYEFRVGTDKQFRVVTVKPHGDGGARFDMAHVALGN